MNTKHVDIMIIIEFDEKVYDSTSPDIDGYESILILTSSFKGKKIIIMFIFSLLFKNWY